MKNNISHAFKKQYILVWVIEAIVGIVMMVTVFTYSSSADVRRTQQRLYDYVSYIKEQCNNDYKLDLASETKSLMRVIVSVEQISSKIQDEAETDEDDLYRYAKESYVTGVIILDSEGNIQKQRCMDSVDGNSILESLSPDEIMGTMGYPEKVYARRITCDDGSYIDIAAMGMSDGQGVVLSYYHTLEEYASNFNQSLMLLLNGYNIEADGTIVISNGNKIIASNNKELVGEDTEDIDIISQIMNSASGSKLVHTYNEFSNAPRKFGLMEKSRDYYIYSYVNEKDVFDTTPYDMLYAMLIYLFLIVVVYMLRWKMSQTYEIEQMRIQTKYADELKHKNEQLKEAVEKSGQG